MTMTAADSLIDSSIFGFKDRVGLSNRECAQSYSIPRDVVNKYSVESVSGSVEQVISSKLVEDTFEQEEAFYIVDLGIVVKKIEAMALSSSKSETILRNQMQQQPCNRSHFGEYGG